MLRYRSLTSKGPLSYEPSIHTNQCVPTDSTQAINPEIYRHCLKVLFCDFISSCAAGNRAYYLKVSPSTACRSKLLSPSLEGRLQALGYLQSEPFHKGTFSPVLLPSCSRKWVLKKRKEIGFRISFQRRYLVSPGRFLTALSRETMAFLWPQCIWASLPHFLTHDSNANSLKGSQCLMLVRQGGH